MGIFVFSINYFVTSLCLPLVKWFAMSVLKGYSRTKLSRNTKFKLEKQKIHAQQS